MSTMDLPLFALVESYHTRGSLTTARERAHGERKAREQEERVLRYFPRQDQRHPPRIVRASRTPLEARVIDRRGLELAS